jgi:uncharacterized membrane protein
MYSSGLGTARVFLIFISCSFIGWVSEVLYVGIFSEHKFVNRGFLHGPVCPIYGFGGLIILFGLTPWKNTWIPLFFASMILTSTLEYATSWLLETLFHTKWWDYSKNFCNINGRVCLLNSLLFGIMGILGEHFLRPFLFGLFTMIDDRAAFWIATGLLAVFAADILATVHRLVDFSASLAKAKEFSESLKERYAQESWFRNETIASMLASVKERAAVNRAQFNTALLERIESFGTISHNNERWLRRFPTMTSRDYATSIEQLKERLTVKIAALKENKLKK